MIIHDLGGCAPTPLAHYLKALGITRLVAEQADRDARGWWDGEHFRLATRLDRSELEDFFLERYEPTPLFNPWGARSGFYPGSSEKSAREVLKAIEGSKDRRFETYRVTVLTIREVIDITTGGTKPKNKEERDRLVLAFRCAVRGKSALWMDSVSAVVGIGESLHVSYPALFGTGGSEGSGSYTSAYMAAIDQCLFKRAWNHAIPTVLFGEGAAPNCRGDQVMGQFLPSGVATPWDLLLAFEGACVVRTAVSWRNTTDNTRWMSSPFYVAPTSYGYASEARLDEYVVNKGKEMPGRGEQWFPLWQQPMQFEEISQMFVEGRATTTRGRATDGWSMVRAITSLGIRQGIREFVRYGYQQRNNLATHFAIPLGRYRVPEHQSTLLPCLDDLDAWIPRLRRHVHAKEAPSRLRIAGRRLIDALFAVTQHPGEPGRWQTVLLALAEVEGVLRTGSGLRAGPAPRLRPEWVQAADDGSSELRLAVAFALQARAFTRDEYAPIEHVRRHWLPLKGTRFDTTGTGGQTRLLVGPQVVLRGRSGLADAIALVDRRLIEAARRGERRLPLVAARRAAAHSTDLAALVAGEIDLDRTLALARALMAVDGRAWAASPLPPRSPAGYCEPDDAWLAIRLALLPWPLPDGRRLGCDPAIIRRLAGGDAATAVDLALRRLRAGGIQTAVRAATAPPDTARRWVAALAFPITQKTAVRFMHRLDPREEMQS